MHSATGAVHSSLPAYLMEELVVHPTADEEHDEEWQSKNGESAVDRFKLRAGDSAVEAPQIAGPEKQDGHVLDGSPAWEEKEE